MLNIVTKNFYILKMGGVIYIDNIIKLSRRIYESFTYKWKL